MAWWPWRRSGDEPASVVAPAPVSLNRPPLRAWADLHPVQRVLSGPIAPVAPLDLFRAGLATSRDPSFLAPLSHAVDPSFGGLVDGITSAAEPRVRADGPPLPVPPRPSSSAPRVQRSVARWSSPDEPVVPASAAEPDLEAEPDGAAELVVGPVAPAEVASSAEGGSPAAPEQASPAPSIGPVAVERAGAVPTRTLAAVADPGPPPVERPRLPVTELPVVSRLATTSAGQRDAVPTAPDAPLAPLLGEESAPLSGFAAAIAAIGGEDAASPPADEGVEVTADGAEMPAAVGLPVQRSVAAGPGTPDAVGVPAAGGAGVAHGVPRRRDDAAPGLPELPVVSRAVDDRAAQSALVPTTPAPTYDAPTLGTAMTLTPAPAVAPVQRTAESPNAESPNPAANRGAATQIQPSAVVQRLTHQGRPTDSTAQALRGPSTGSGQALRQAQGPSPLSAAPFSAVSLLAESLSAGPFSAVPFAAEPLAAEPFAAATLSSAPIIAAPVAAAPISERPILQRAVAAPPVVLRQAVAPTAVYRSTSFAEMFSPGPAASAPATADVASVQREAPEPAPEPVPEVPPEPAPTAAAAPAPAAAAAPGGSASDVEAMAERLYEPLAARLRAELWQMRERAGV